MQAMGARGVAALLCLSAVMGQDTYPDPQYLGA